MPRTVAVVRSRVGVFLLLAAGLLLGLLCRHFLHPTLAHLGERSGPVVVLGDSLSAGVGSETHRGYVAVLQARTGLTLINKGVPGDTTGQALSRLQTDVLDLKPSLVLVELGGNDFLNRVEPQETRANLERILNEIEGQGAAVILLGAQGGIFSDRAADMYRDLARSHHAGLVPNIMAGVFTDPGLKSDPVHPNDAGYEKLADRIEPELRWCMQRLRRS